MTRAARRPDRAVGMAAAWSVKGIDPRAREVARDVARRSGLTLAEWLSQLITDAGEEPAPAPKRRPKAVAAATTVARSRARAEVDAARVVAELAQFMSRLEAVERRVDPRLEGVDAIEDAIGKVAAQIGKGEARAELQALQSRESMRMLRHRIDRLEAQPPTPTPVPDMQLAQLIARIDRLESASAPAVETSLVDAALSRLMERVEEGQHHAVGSLRALEGALSGLEQLVGQMAAAPLARGAAEPPRDHDDAAVRDLSEQVAETEHRSAKAINQMGQEVIRIAQSLDGRVVEVERRSDERAAAMGGKISRLASVMDDRLSRADAARAGALEELGGQIASVADQLADRITASEHRSVEVVARGLDEVGERLQRAIDKLNAHYARAADEIASRVSESEARTDKLVADAREHADGVQQRLDQPAARAIRRSAGPSDAPPPAPAPRNGLEPLTVLSPHDAVEPAYDPPPAARPSANQELIEQARAAARQSAEAGRHGAKRGPAGSLDGGSGAMEAGEVLVLRSGLSGLLGRRRRQGAGA